jgi:hypothetical protein
MRTWPALLLFVVTTGAGAPAVGHERTLEECLLPMSHAKCVGADNTHAVRVHVA